MKNTLTIGIAAFNEEKNIGYLLSAILKQQVKSAQLIEIIVVSDASTDVTDDIVRSAGSSLVRLMRHEKRSGAVAAQNTIIQNALGDILLILDADILPESDGFVEAIIRPIAENKQVGLTSAKIIPAAPGTFTGKVLARNHIFKTKLFYSIKGGDNIYACFGPARGFSRALYSKIMLPKNCPTDAASYLACKREGFQFVPVTSHAVIFSCSSTMADHVKQSSRFFAGKLAISEEFGKDSLKEYEIPLILKLNSAAAEMIARPVFFFWYIFISIYSSIKGKHKEFKDLWDISGSTKKII